MYARTPTHSRKQNSCILEICVLTLLNLNNLQVQDVLPAADLRYAILLTAAAASLGAAL